MYKIVPIRPTTTPIVYKDAFYQWEIKNKNIAEKSFKYAIAGGNDDGNDPKKFSNIKIKNTFDIISKNLKKCFKMI